MVEQDWSTQRHDNRRSLVDSHSRTDSLILSLILIHSLIDLFINFLFIDLLIFSYI